MFPSNSTPDRDFRSTVASIRPGLAFVIIIFGALIAFEIFNYTTTDHALRDLLGDLTFAGVSWATILAIAFCGIDFAGIARLFTPEQGTDEPKEVWYLFGAWLLAATMNAILTWWGVSMAVVNHAQQSASVIDPGTLTSVVPVFVAVMVWVIRILIIGTLSMALDRLMHPGGNHTTLAEQTIAASQSRPARTQTPPAPPVHNIPTSLGTSSTLTPRPSAARAARNGSSTHRQAQFSGADDSADNFGASPNHSEPTYHSLSGRPPRGSENSGSERFRRS